ncbi:MAG: TetR/AcrR family transcriptional regulator [Patulibacter sp.]|nr:TetR/AcrR family transcriptional regulator [Patulibacter sp.]
MLASLPPGWSFVPETERERLLAAFAVAVYADGFGATRLADVSRAIGVDPSVAAAYWPDETACLLDAVETATSQAFSRMAQVFLATDSDCATAAHHALATLLTDLAACPEMVYLAVVELPRLGPVGHAQQARILDLFCEFLEPGFATTGHPVPDPEIVAVSLGGGVWETVRRLAIERRLSSLPDELPAISFVCISTFFGTDEALRVSRIPVRVTPRRPVIG